MKKTLLLIVTLFTLTAKSQTSVYHPFPDSSANWNFHYFLSCIGSGSSDEYYSITIAGDTLINSQTYHKLFTPFVQSVISGVCSGNSFGYRGAVRNDTTSKKVFYIQPADTVEQLLYDFNLQVGDTVPGFLESFAFPPDTVHSIDSVLVGSIYRKRWNINSCYNISIIEGVGSTYGLIQPSPGCMLDQADYSLTCFTQNGMTLYPDTTTNCNLITSIKDISAKMPVTTISPNPFHSSALLQISPEFENAELKIYNSLGMLIGEERILNQKTFMLNRNELQNGIYLFQLINTKGKMTTGQFVID